MSYIGIYEYVIGVIHDLREELEALLKTLTYKILELQRCPKCKKEFTEHPALSREDNETEICPECGVREAVEVYESNKSKDNKDDALDKLVQKDNENRLKYHVNAVNEAIFAERRRLEKILEEDEPDPVMLEGETEKGYYVQMMIDPKIPIQIMLEYDYPTWKILGAAAPDDMWRAMAEKVGLASVTMVDL